MATRGAQSWRLATIATLLLTGLLVAVVLFSLREEDFKTKIERVDLPPEIGRCTTDADCVLVDKIGCCPCSSGGARWAINTEETEALRRLLKHACRESGICVRADTCRTDLAPACVEGRCVAKIIPIETHAARGCAHA